MLYHWREIEQQARPTAPIIYFDRTDAIAQARGGICRATHIDIPAPSNDAEPDSLATKLKLSGLGTIGDPIHRVHYNDISQPRRILKRFFERLSSIVRRLCRTRSKVTAAGCSHTIVAKCADALDVEADDAHRQLFRLSGR